MLLVIQSRTGCRCWYQRRLERRYVLTDRGTFPNSIQRVFWPLSIYILYRKLIFLPRLSSNISSKDDGIRPVIIIAPPKRSQNHREVSERCTCRLGHFYILAPFIPNNKLIIVGPNNKKSSSSSAPGSKSLVRMCRTCLEKESSYRTLGGRLRLS
jgi:hypothetical protein